MSELGEVVASIPPVTRTITLTSLVMAGLNSFGVVPYSSFTCYFPDIFRKFELYRMLTGFLIPNPQPMQGLMEVYMLYTFSKGLEVSKFKRNLPDFLYYLMLILPTMLVGSYFFLPAVLSLSPALLSAFTFTWSVANYDQKVNFYFMPIKASLLPAVSLGFRLLVDGQLSFMLSLLGMAAAYFYNCMETHSFGPLVALVSSKEPTPNQTRLGTVNNYTAWYYSTGELPAPQWLRKTVSKLTGVDYNTAPLNRGFAVIPPQTRNENSSKKASAGGSSFMGTAFRGKGRRLGTKEE
ncbi:DEKNAAC105615 [Brettanomyces naardenensis]|uniref:Derlin n=1 Tax=Brettanomyces naardenensis TaxID=13370 RepID=A0A448YTZ6_BRENA|nr:DEKNAAC105615 [Brettanomyces naardenensis]